jgi:hypothetical protein
MAPGMPRVPGAAPPPGRRPPHDRAPQRRRRAPNAVRGAYLARFDHHEEPDWSLEVETAGPWKVEPPAIDGEDGFGVHHGWERPGLATPAVWFTTFERARMAVAVLPALGAEPWLTLRMTGQEPIGCTCAARSASASARSPTRSGRRPAARRGFHSAAAAGGTCPGAGWGGAAPPAARSQCFPRPQAACSGHLKLSI